jgi:hypothetical protein
MRKETSRGGRPLVDEVGCAALEAVHHPASPAVGDQHNAMSVSVDPSANWMFTGAFDECAAPHTGAERAEPTSRLDAALLGSTSPSQAGGKSGECNSYQWRHAVEDQPRTVVAQWDDQRPLPSEQLVPVVVKGSTVLLSRAAEPMGVLATTKLGAPFGPAPRPLRLCMTPPGLCS